MGEGRRVVVRAPLLDELQHRVELEQLRGGGAAGRPGVAAAREHEEVALGVLRHADGFADRVTRDLQVQHLLGDLQLRRGLLQFGLLGERGAQFRAGPALLGDGAGGQREYGQDGGERTGHGSLQCEPSPRAGVDVAGFYGTMPPHDTCGVRGGGIRDAHASPLHWSVP